MGPRVVSHHVDGLELSCSVVQVKLLMQHATDRLEDRLARRLSATREPAAQPLPMGWTWNGDEPVMLEPFSFRKRYPYTLTCSAWAVFVAPAGSMLPRVVVQLRAGYLRADPGAAYAHARAWVEEHLLSLVDGVPAGESPVWRVSRLDLAADVAGISLAARDLDRFTSRSRSRTTFHELDLTAPVRTHSVGRRLAGFSFGRRGAGTGLHARVYDKTLEMVGKPDEALREHWRGNGWNGQEGVWRVEYEVRRKFLRTARTSDGNRLAADPSRLVTGQLGPLWRHLTGEWLVLRDAGIATRIERCAPTAWWTMLAGLELGIGPSSTMVERVGPETNNLVALLRQATGVLASIGAAQGTADLDLVLGAVRAHIEHRHGRQGFAEKVARRDLRSTVSSRLAPRMVEHRAGRLLRRAGKHTGNQPVEVRHAP